MQEPGREDFVQMFGSESEQRLGSGHEVKQAPIPLGSDGDSTPQDSSVSGSTAG